MSMFVRRSKINHNAQIERSQKLMNALYVNGKVISVGKFLEKVGSNYLLEIRLSFISGTAFPLNYLITKGLCMLFRRQCYLEIGSYIGDSIYNVLDVCKKCISITAPLGSQWSMRDYCIQYKFNDYSNYMVDTKNVEQYLVNSQHFDFKKITSHPDIILIDGEGTYDGVKTDTLNIWKIKSRDAIILWQLVKRNPSSKVAYNDILAAIKDCLTKEEWRNFYLFDNSTLGIFIPNQYMDEIRDCLSYNKDILYTYNLKVVANEGS